MSMEAEKIKGMFTSFCSVEDVCKANRVSVEELDAFCRSEFSMPLGEAVDMFAAQGRAMVHRAQIDAALDGNNSMLILLGKQYLGQTDDPKQNNSEKEETPLDNVLKLYSGAKDRKARAAR